MVMMLMMMMMILKLMSSYHSVSIVQVGQLELLGGQNLIAGALNIVRVIIYYDGILVKKWQTSLRALLSCVQWLKH